MNIFFEIHKNLPREGPGDNQYTREIFLLLSSLPEKPHILDIGCGPGMQTLELARNTKGTITAIDTHLPFLEVLNQKIGQEGFSGRVKTEKMSMFTLKFPKDSFDVIWSEGAIYIMGFQRGLKEWKQYLKSGGYLVVSEISWLKENIPPLLKAFWMEAYPGIRSISGNIARVQQEGYHFIRYLVLSDSAWWKNYYDPLIKRISKLKIKYRNNKEAMAQLEDEEKEMEIFRKYSDIYGYVYYVMKKNTN